MRDPLLEEVDADIRAERMEQLWRRYRKPLLTAAIALILLTAANSVWQQYRQERGGKLMQQFSTAQALLDAGDAAKAAEAFAELAHKTGGDKQTIAQIWQSRALVAADKPEDAAAILKKAVSGKPSLWTDIACLRLVSLDNAQNTCLASRKDSPLASERREWQAASLWSAGKHDEAIAILEQLATSADTPEAKRARIGEWLSTLRAEKAGA